MPNNALTSYVISPSYSIPRIYGENNTHPFKYSFFPIIVDTASWEQNLRILEKAVVLQQNIFSLDMFLLANQ